LRRVAVEIARAYDVTPRVEVVVGDPFETLMQASERADLVVLGRRGDGRRKGLRVGGTVDRMLRICRRPVLVVKTPVEQPYRRILVPIDFTASCDAAIRIAARLRSASAMQVFHAIDSQREAVLREADVSEALIRETRLLQEARTNARMRRKIARLGLDDTPMSFALAHGPAVRSTLRHARTFGADLIVAGKQGRSTAAAFLLGSVSSRVLSGSDCDMLIVPRPRDEAPPYAVSALLPRVPSAARADNAVLAAGAAAHAGAGPTAHWIDNTARFVSRRVS
jgi:nucleotide-binding universal stress UspA family protein